MKDMKEKIGPFAITTLRFLCVCIALACLLSVNSSSVTADEAVGHDYGTIAVDNTTHEAQLDEYSRESATVRFSSTLSGTAEIASCSDPGITCTDFVTDTAYMTLNCEGTPSLKGGWSAPAFSGSCWRRLNACYYCGTTNEIKIPINPQADPSLPINSDYVAYSKCTPALYEEPVSKQLCFHENASPEFTADTSDDMFKLREGGSAFLEYARIGSGLDTPYRLTWVRRTGGIANRGVMLPSGPFTTFDDFKNFIDNPPFQTDPSPKDLKVYTAKNNCYPVRATMCEGDFTSYAPPQNGQCGTLHTTYVGSAPPNDIAESSLDKSKCARGTDTPVSLNTATEPNRYEWTCNGLDGGEPMSCYALRPLNGQCGSAAGTNSYGQPTQNLCAKGTASDVTKDTGTNTWSWTCLGMPGAPLSTDASCTANIIVDGSCGTAQGGEYNSTPPAGDLCSAGNNGAVTNNTCGYTWTCNGINGGLPMNCQANKVQICDPVNVYANWRYFGTTSSAAIFNGSGGRMRNNCATGYTPTEMGDDADSRHSLSEDKSSGGDRAQLCIGTSNANVTFKSEWRLGGCSADMQHTGVFDSNTSAGSVDSKYWVHKHMTYEEENVSNQLYWCIGLDGPDKDKYDLTVSQVSSASCGGSGTLLINASGTEWNVNNEDGTINRSVCARISPKAGATCATCGGACGAANGVAATTPPSSNLCAVGSTASSVTSASDSYIWTCSASGVTANCIAPKILNGVCGPADSVPAVSLPVDDLCTIGTESTVVDTGNNYTWSCSGLNGGSSDSCLAPKPLCAAPQAGQCGPANNGSYIDADAANAAGLCTIGTATVSGNGPWSWVCPGINGGGNSPTCNALQSTPPQIGVCGPANGNSYANATSVNTAGLCSAGSAPAASGSGPWSWTCAGSGGGANSPTCTASVSAPVVYGSCGPANGNSYTIASSVNTAGLCNAGTSAPVSGSGPWSWTCAGSGGGTNSPTCTAYLSDPIVTGSCGPANGNSYASASAVNTAGICNAGTSAPVSGSGPWSWTCAGSGGGTNSPTCTASVSTPVVNGACNNSVALGCTQGSPISDNGQTACGTTRQWVCQGSGGGTNSGTCSRANAACTTVNGACTTFTGTHASQPATSTANGCSAGAYADVADTSTEWRWSCNGGGSPAGTNATCTAARTVSCSGATAWNGVRCSETENRIEGETCTNSCSEGIACTGVQGPCPGAQELDYMIECFSPTIDVVPANATGTCTYNTTEITLPSGNYPACDSGGSHRSGYCITRFYQNNRGELITDGGPLYCTRAPAEPTIYYGYQCQ